MGGQGRTASARTTSANIPPRPSTHPNLGALRSGGVTSGLFRWGDRRTSSARGMIGRTTSASLVSLRGRRAQHEYEPVHTPRGGAVPADEFRIRLSQLQFRGRASVQTILPGREAAAPPPASPLRVVHHSHPRRPARSFIHRARRPRRRARLQMAATVYLRPHRLARHARKERSRPLDVYFFWRK